MTQFIRLTLAISRRPVLVNVAHIQDILPHHSEGTTLSLGVDNTINVAESFDVIEANLRLMAYITDMEATQ